jgi:hypothetical protein
MFFSPPGAEHVEGNGTSATMFGSVAAYQSRIQHADNNFVGHPLFLITRSIAWRRNGPSGAGVPRVAEITLIMSHADYNTFSATFASNYKDTPVTVFTKKNVNLPDWSVRPMPPPAAFDLVVPFDVPWVYNRIDALLWEIVVTNTSAAGSYDQDWFAGAATMDWSQTHVDQGPGCTTANGTFTKKDVHRSDATNLQVGFQISGGPPSAAVIVLVGRQLQTLTVPGLCGPIRTDILLTLLPGVTDPSGNLPPSYQNIPWQAGFSGLLLTAQAVAPDPSQPGIGAAVSNATLVGLPKTAGTPGVNVQRNLIANSSTGTVGTLSMTAVATRFTD